jgi:hypothetical protein
MGKWRYVKNPQKTTALQEGQWATEIKDKAVETYASCGNLSQVARELNVPYRTIQKWKESEWWGDKIKQLQSEHQDKVDVKLTQALDIALDGLTDRLINGDVIVDPRTGKERVVPAKLRDITTAFNTILDKRQLLRKQPTRIVEQSTTATHLQNLAEQFAKFVGQAKPETQADLIEVIEGETVEYNSETNTYQIKE